MSIQFLPSRLSAIVLQSHPGPYHGPHGGYWGGAGSGMAGGAGWWFALLTVAVVLLAAVGLVLLVLRTQGEADAGGEADADPALAILRERYAAGDLSDEEFERRRSRLDR